MIHISTAHPSKYYKKLVYLIIEGLGHELYSETTYDYVTGLATKIVDGTLRNSAYQFSAKAPSLYMQPILLKLLFRIIWNVLYNDITDCTN